MGLAGGGCFGSNGSEGKEVVRGGRCIRQVIEWEGAGEGNALDMRIGQ